MRQALGGQGAAQQAEREVSRASLLELLHPLGMARNMLVLGGNCPPLLRPVPYLPAANSAELVVVAPTDAEYEAPGWLAEAVRAAAAALAPDGLAYVFVPPRRRRDARRLLRREGLSVGPAIWHYPDWPSSSLLIPINWRGVRYAFTHLIPTRPWRRQAVLAALRAPGAARVLAAVLAPVGLVARRPDSRPPLAWLAEPGDETPQRLDAVISTSWRGSAGAVLVHRFSGREVLPSAVAKLALSAARADQYHAEAVNLESVGAQAARAGAQVPRVLRRPQTGPQSALIETALIETALIGQPASALLAGRPEQLPGILGRVADWLEAWNRVTLSPQGGRQGEVVGTLLQAAGTLAPELDGGRVYFEWLQARCDRGMSQVLPCVATHNDLTMANVLLDAQGRLGVLDWETACAAGLPLVDFFYAAVDAVAATTGYADRPGSFEACYGENGRWAGYISGLRRRLSEAVGLTPDLDELCFHACWLHHALNEKRATQGAGPRPFLQIVQAASRQAAAQSGAYAAI